jgi:hypothetical protein
MSTRCSDFVTKQMGLMLACSSGLQHVQTKINIRIRYKNLSFVTMT